MFRRLAQLIDTVPTHLRLGRVQRGPAAHTRADIRFVDLDDSIIRFRQAGRTGPSLVMATDPPVPLELYDDLIAVFEPHFRISIFELPGFGCSLPRTKFRFSLPRASAVVARVLEQLPHGPHILAMPCVTAYIAVAIANKHPELVQQLVFLQAPSWPDGQAWLQRRDPAGVLRRPVLGQVALAALRRRRIRAWYAAAVGDADLVEFFSEATLENFDHGGCFCLASGFQDFLSEPQSLVKPVTQDSLIVWGRADPSHRHSEPLGAATFAPNNHAVCLDKIGHFPDLETPRTVLKELLSFLNRSSA